MTKKIYTAPKINIVEMSCTTIMAGSGVQLMEMERQALLLIMVTKCKQANLGLHTLHQESTSIAGLTTQTISKQFAD